LYKTRDAGKAGIGVDTDQHETIPQVGSSLITSCMKHLDESIISEMTAISQGKFHGGQTTTSNLLNNGVDLAPYHEFDTLLPDSIKQAVITIKQGIISGAIKTGWQ
jgi:basic membrane protein A